MFETIVQKGVAVLLIAAIIYIVIRLIVGHTVKKYTWIDTDAFNEQISIIRSRCTEETLHVFMHFLSTYKGGYIKKSGGKIVLQAYSTQEKDDLSRLFLEVIVSKKFVSLKTKEDFRHLIQRLGAPRVEYRPSYEDFEKPIVQKESNDQLKDRQRAIKRKAETMVADVLSMGLDLKRNHVFNNIYLTNGDEKRRFDHIVVNDNGVFVLETKSFGMEEFTEQYINCELYIEKGDKWSIRIGNDMQNLESPTLQVLEEKRFIEDFAGDLLLKVHPVVVLPKKDMIVYKKATLPYEIIGTRELCDFLQQPQEIFNLNDQLAIISRLNEA